MDLKTFEQDLERIIKKVATSVHPDTLKALEIARNLETGPARSQLETMLRAIKIGTTRGIPVCQDTGTLTFFVEVGTNFPDFDFLGKFREVIMEVARRATKEIPLRPNTVDPLTHKNPGDNTGRNVPVIEWELNSGDEMKIGVLLKGGGSENMSHLEMMDPGKGLKGIKEIVLDWIAKMEGKPCPPTIVGVGLGGSSNLALTLAKKAILRSTGERHPDRIVAEMEKELLSKANKLGVGPMGVGGKTTVLDVKIEYAARHPASFPVGIVPQCWCDRKVWVRVNPGGRVEVIK
jgi:fumarate hydratase subunit alpha